MPARTLNPIQGIQRNPLGIDRYQRPDIVNSAARAIQFGEMLNPKAEPINAAAVRLLELKEDQRKAQSSEKIAQNEFSLNVLSGVNSAEDWERAKAIMISRYPETRRDIESRYPEYHPRTVELIKNALRDETQKLKGEELGIEAYKAETGRAVAGTGQYEAETGRVEAGTDVERMKTERKTSELRGFAPGTGIMYHPEGQDVPQYAGEVPFKDPAPEGFELFADEAGKQIYVQEGGDIPAGYNRVEKKTGPMTSVTVQTGDLTTGVKSQLQKDIIKGSQNVQSFKKTAELFKNSYLTWWGKTDKEVASVMDKAGLASKAQKKLIKERNSWFVRAKNDFFIYRKWATGVAGGTEEMKEIATAFPDPVKNSPSEYRANLEAVEETTKAVLMLNQDFLSLEVDMNDPIDVILRKAQEVGIKPPPGTSVKASGAGTEDVIMNFNELGERID